MNESIESQIKSAISLMQNLEKILESVLADVKLIEKNEMTSDSGSAEKEVREVTSSSVSIDDVRKVLADAARSKGEISREFVREILKRYGANKLSEVDPVHYEAIKLEAQCIYADPAMIRNEAENLASNGLMDRVKEVISQFTEDGSQKFAMVPEVSYPALMRALVTLRGMENE